MIYSIYSMSSAINTICHKFLLLFRIAVDVLRICGKACVNMRKFGWAELLIQQAVARARVCYGRLHPKYASALLDYGFYFLNVDCILNSVTVYEAGNFFIVFFPSKISFIYFFYDFRRP